MVCVMIDDIVDLFTEDAQGKGVSLGALYSTASWCDTAVRWSTDLQRLRQVVVNMLRLSNALKFTGAVAASCWCCSARRRVCSASSVVTLGRESGRLTRLCSFNDFDKYQSTAVVGTGLGLFISTKAMQALSGWFALQSTLGGIVLHRHVSGPGRHCLEMRCSTRPAAGGICNTDGAWQTT